MSDTFFEHCSCMNLENFPCWTVTFPFALIQTQLHFMCLFSLNTSPKDLDKWPLKSYRDPDHFPNHHYVIMFQRQKYVKLRSFLEIVRVISESALQQPCICGQVTLLWISLTSMLGKFAIQRYFQKIDVFSHEPFSCNSPGGGCYWGTSEVIITFFFGRHFC